MDSTPALTAVISAFAEFKGEPLSLLVGEPFFPPPEWLKEALIRAAGEGCNRYSEPHGSLGLRKTICRLEARRGVNISPEQVVVGNGAKGLLFGLLNILGHGGVMTPLPAYPAMLVQPELLRFGLRTIETDPPEFRLAKPQLEKIERPGSCLVLSSPSNPAGTTYGDKEQRVIIEWCRRNAVRLIADETYCDLTLQGDFTSFATNDRELATALVVRSFSKSFGICGWRLGYAICDPETARRLAAWHTAALNTPSTLVQRALEIGLPAATDDFENHREHYRATAALIVRELNRSGLEAKPPEGGFFILAKASPLFDRLNVSSSTEFCERLAGQFGLGLWPGEDFGVPGWIRASFGTVSPDKRDEIACEMGRRLRRFVNGNVGDTSRE